MSHQSEASRKRRQHQHHTGANAPFTGIPLWSSLSIVGAALITGLLLAVSAGSLGWIYLGLFIVAALVTSLLTEPRGLFLLVVSIPLLFSVFTVATGLGIVANSPGENNGLSTTEIITGIYPLLQHFPVMFLTTALAALIAVVRIYLLKRNAARSAKNAHKVRVHDMAAQKRNQDTYTKSRSLAERSSAHGPAAFRRSRDANRVTVDELVSRRRPRTRQPDEVLPRHDRSAKPHKIQSQDNDAWNVHKDAPQKPQVNRERTEKKWKRSFNDDLYS